jgi:cell division septum initiation protein DivIVA
MTDKEFKKLNRAQLIDIIYQLQLQIEKLTQQNQALESQLADKKIRLSQAGNIAEAALEINDCFRSAQNAAEQYLSEIRALREQTEVEQRRILDQTKSAAEAILASARDARGDCDFAIEAILREFKQNQSDNG